MSLGRELQKQITEDNTPEVPNVQQQSNTMAELIGITARNMVEKIIDDLSTMIEKEYRDALEGYVLCLSRIIKHETAWHCISEAFAHENEQVPKKYYELFGQDPDKIPKRRGISVE